MGIARVFHSWPVTDLNRNAYSECILLSSSEGMLLSDYFPGHTVFKYKYNNKH